jgi:hypothetical protein
MSQEPTPDPDNRVVPLRRRTPQAAGPQRPEPPDLSRFERGGHEDDYRHRMLTNVIALAFTALLVLGGIWVANTVADLRKTQDCVMSGRRVCSPMPVPSADR